MASSIQFKGIDSVVAAYENRDVPAWSLWQGKQFIFKYEGNSIDEGSQQLTEYLNMLAQSTNAIYTLKVYEDVPGGKIKSNTPDDGSFNFKINADSQEITNNQYSRMNNSNAILERLERMEQRLIEREEEEGDEEPESKLGLIGEIISHPTIQPIAQAFITNILGIGKTNGTAAPAQMPRAAISGINDDAILSEAIKELTAHDPKLPEHLAKLAALAKENPQGFQFLLTTLDNM